MSRFWLIGMVGFCATLISVPTAFADWHKGTYTLLSGGKEIGTQQFKVTVSETSGKLFATVKAQGKRLQGEGNGEFTGAIELEADGSFAKYKTVEKTKGKPKRAITFVYKGKVRQVQKPKKPVDIAHPLEAPVVDMRLVPHLSLLTRRYGDHAGEKRMPVLNAATGALGEVILNTLGTAGVRKKGKFIEVTRISIKGVPGARNWVAFVDSGGRVLYAEGGKLTASLEGVEPVVPEKPEEPSEDAEAKPTPEPGVEE